MDRVDVAVLGGIDEIEAAEVVTGAAEVVPLGGIDGPVVGAVHVGQVEIQAVPAPDEIGILGSEVRRAVGQDRHAERMPGPRLLAAVAAAVVDHVLVEAGVREMTRIGGAVDLEPLVRQAFPDGALGTEDGHRRLVPADAVDGDVLAQHLAQGRQTGLHRLPDVGGHLLVGEGPRALGRREVGRVGRSPHAVDDEVGGESRLAVERQLAPEDVQIPALAGGQGRVGAATGHGGGVGAVARVGRQHRTRQVVIAETGVFAQQPRLGACPVVAVLAEVGAQVAVGVGRDDERLSGIVAGARFRKREGQHADGERDHGREPAVDLRLHFSPVPAFGILRRAEGDPELLEPAGLEREGLQARRIADMLRPPAHRRRRTLGIADPEVPDRSAGRRRPHRVLHLLQIDFDQRLVVQEQIRHQHALAGIGEVAAPAAAALRPDLDHAQIKRGGRQGAVRPLQVADHQFGCAAAGGDTGLEEKGGRLELAPGGDQHHRAAQPSIQRRRVRQPAEIAQGGHGVVHQPGGLHGGLRTTACGIGCVHGGLSWVCAPV